MYALPGRVTEALSEGCNRLIKQGAGVAISPQEIIKEVLGENYGSGASVKLLSALQADLLDTLEEVPQSVEKIKEHMLRKGGPVLSAAESASELMRLSIAGLAKQIGNGYFIKA